MFFGNECRLLCSLGQQVHFAMPTITTPRPSLYQSLLCAAVNQHDGTVVLALQALGKLAHRGPLTPLESFQVQQQLILQRGQAMSAADFLALAQKTAQPIAKVRESSKVFLGQYFSSLLRTAGPTLPHSRISILLDKAKPHA